MLTEHYHRLHPEALTGGAETARLAGSAARTRQVRSQYPERKRGAERRDVANVSMISGALAVARAGPSGLPGRPFAVVALIAWLLTAGIGAYMLRTWVVRGGLRAQRATGVGVPPAVVFGHASAALTGLAVWLSYLGTGWAPLAWLGVGFIATAIMLGICTVTMWTPYPIAVPEAVPEVARAGARLADQHRPTQPGQHSTGQHSPGERRPGEDPAPSRSPMR